MKIQVTSFLSYHSSALYLINLKYFKYFRFFFCILMKVICTFMGEEQGNFQLLLIGLNEPHSGADGTSSGTEIVQLADHRRDPAASRGQDLHS